ncbi:MAG: disulfide bond formation protein B [Novosphingobium sp. 28-62-57]|uniref:disulfide bond formation protein B n=1 Tax=unclassified Novosphingobium TaxID=2644732 RepID=UPI000BC90B51|nr:MULTISPECIES: disulfide bond formation protein B [unclassified Novosphingobium]OYW50183.1 MAG: disulfide bond formation protein B [Novosphingobium sp. 12-62-10]OYZ11712.1 MAG: disulfide bond formation protein B [Novosphingobium sp. 28-62-57]OZA37226.1 MAG: disulfide bond formation protein B [Novosphingobium sp. 17-62-9]HQS69817.1 disulfide bond formation protein B [Novosphingobium sp.]
MNSRNAAYALALVVPAAAMGGALISQYGFGLYPCEMCWWQRYPHIAAIVLALLAFTMKGRGAGDMAVILAAIAVGISGLIGGFHAGVEYGWWEGITACATVASGTGNPLDAIMNAPLVRCDVAPWSLFGISLAGFNFLISTGCAVFIFALLGKARNPGRKGL